MSPKNKNIALALFERQTNSRRRVLTALPPEMSKRISNSFGKMPALCLQLKEACERDDSLTSSRVKECLKKASDMLAETQERGEFPTEADEQNTRIRQWFVLFGGARYLVRLLQVGRRNSHKPQNVLCKVLGLPYTSTSSIPCVFRDGCVHVDKCPCVCAARYQDRILLQASWVACPWLHGTICCPHGAPTCKVSENVWLAGTAEPT